jgi:glycosyltransferase involved in cell wall biosynthesis
MKYPKVSCVCPTFARAYLLEEAIESFLRQDYPGEKELIICNDFVEQELIYDHSKVKVINLPERTPNLGSKRNKAYSYATGDVFLTWGDDDIHLPGRISRMVNAMQEFNSEFVFEGPYYIIYGGKLSFENGKTSGAHIITKDLFYNAGQIPEINSGEDQAFNSKVKEYLNLKSPLPVCKDNPQFLYRWSSGRAHISQYGVDKENKKSGYELFLEQAREYVKQGKEPAGKYHLKPNWSKDWVEETKKLSI